VGSSLCHSDRGPSLPGKKVILTRLFKKEGWSTKKTPAEKKGKPLSSKGKSGTGKKRHYSSSEKRMNYFYRKSFTTTGGTLLPYPGERESLNKKGSEIYYWKRVIRKGQLGGGYLHRAGPWKVLNTEEGGYRAAYKMARS